MLIFQKQNALFLLQICFFVITPVFARELPFFVKADPCKNHTNLTAKNFLIENNDFFKRKSGV